MSNSFQIILHRFEAKIKFKNTHMSPALFLIYTLLIHSFVHNLNLFCYQEADNLQVKYPFQV